MVCTCHSLGMVYLWIIYRELLKAS
jgi:hypothetical protein